MKRTLLFFMTFFYSSYPLIAADTASNIGVSATVSSSCVINQAALTFGTYDPVGPNASAPLHSTSNMQIRCTKNTNAIIKLDTGEHAANASGTKRAMASADGNSYLSYDIYTNASYSTVWTDTDTKSYVANSSSPARIDIYGAIPANQNVSDGVYNDVIVVNATF